MMKKEEVVKSSITVEEFGEVRLVGNYSILGSFYLEELFITNKPHHYFTCYTIKMIQQSEIPALPYTPPVC